MLLTGCALLVLQSSAVQAQWSTGTNINNTNSGTVSVGTTSPGGDKLIVSGNTISGNISSHTQLYSGFDSEANPIMELSYGTATANVTPYSTLVLSKNLTSANQLLGVLQFANRSIADGSDKRIAQIAAYTDATTNSGALAFRTMNAGTANERMRITSSGNVGIGTASPATQLHVVNSATAQARIESSSAAAAVLDFKNPNRRWVIGTGVLAGGGDFSIYDANTSLTRMYFDTSGNVGIGTAAPGGKLDVQRGDGADILIRAWNSSTSSGAAIFRAAASAGGNESARLELTDNTGYNGGMSADHTNGLIFRTGNQSLTYAAMGTRMTITPGGSVGIGTSTPSATLHVQGTGRITGSLTVDGNIAAKYQDVAEWVRSSQQLSAGTVVVLDQTKSNQVIASSQAYDTRVAGVISLQPGISLGESGAGKVLVATTGRVKVKVDATNGPIQIGDLLVTSDQPGLAMKSEPISVGKRAIHSPGTLIGKALEPLASGKGEILVLLSLQ